MTSILKASYGFTFWPVTFVKPEGTVSVISSHICSHQRCSVKKDVLKNFANFTGRHLCWSLFLIKLQSPGAVL